MNPSNTRKCLHCGQFFGPDARNRARQRYCRTPVCRKASKAKSQQEWLSKPENVDYFRGEENAERARTWQAANPGYGKRQRPAQATQAALQDILNSEVPPRETLVQPDEESLLQDICRSQSPLLVGLVAHLVGWPLQDSLAQILHRLAQRGNFLIHGQIPLPSEGKSRRRPGNPIRSHGKGGF